jgi:hypothetical protein
MRLGKRERQREQSGEHVRGSEQTTGRRFRPLARARCAERSRCRGRPARGPHCPSRGRCGPPRGPRFHRLRPSQSNRRRSHPLGHAGPDGRQDRQRPPGRDAGRHGSRTRPQCHPARGHPDGRPARLRQDDLERQDRLPPHPGPAGHGGRDVRRLVLDEAPRHDGLARHPPSGRSAAARRARHPDRRSDAADRAIGDAARHQGALSRRHAARATTF